jgi:hypothetical protein
MRVYKRRPPPTSLKHCANAVAPDEAAATDEDVARIDGVVSTPSTSLLRNGAIAKMAYPLNSGHHEI